MVFACRASARGRAPDRGRFRARFPGDGNADQHRGVGEAVVPDRDGPVWLWRGLERRAVGLGGAVDAGFRAAVEATCRRPMRSWPEASWTAPNVAETARAAKIPLKICDMADVSLAPWRSQTQPEQSRRGSGTGLDHLTVYKNICGAMERLRGLRSHPGSRLFPLPH